MGEVHFVKLSHEWRMTFPERFSNNLIRRFKEVLSELPTRNRPFRGVLAVDLSRTTYIDMYALGMLLLLKERAEKVVLRASHPDVLAVFDYAHFDEIFEIERPDAVSPAV